MRAACVVPTRLKPDSTPRAAVRTSVATDSSSRRKLASAWSLLIRAWAAAALALRFGIAYATFDADASRSGSRARTPR